MHVHLALHIYVFNIVTDESRGFNSDSATIEWWLILVIVLCVLILLGAVLLIYIINIEAIKLLKHRQN